MERDSEFSMNETHEANRRYWDSTSDDWRRLRDEDDLLSILCDEPELAFDAVDGLRRVTIVEAGAPDSVQGRHQGLRHDPRFRTSPRTNDRRSHARNGSVFQDLRRDVG